MKISETIRISNLEHCKRGYGSPCLGENPEPNSKYVGCNECRCWSFHSPSCSFNKWKIEDFKR